MIATDWIIVYVPSVVQEDERIIELDELLSRCLKMDQKSFGISY